MKNSSDLQTLLVVPRKLELILGFSCSDPSTGRLGQVASANVHSDVSWRHSRPERVLLYRTVSDGLALG